jgi:hypothetical protein
VSTILKALQRLDEEKRAELGRSLEEQVLARGGAPRTPPGQRSPRWLAIAIAGLALAGAGAWWLVSPRRPPAIARATQLPERAAPVEPVPASLSAAPLETTPPLEPPPAEPLVEPVAVAEVAPEREAPPAPRPAPLAAAPAPPAAPDPAPPAASGVPEPAPPAATPDVATIAPRPEVWVERTQWHPTAERRRALVRLAGDQPRELSEGDAIGALVIREIQPSGVVFLFQGNEFRRGIGGSGP